MLCNHEIQQRCVEMKELISVIVPVYKVEKYIAACLESILKQTYSNLEIIVVNDGSPDNAMSIVEEYAAKDSRIKCYSKENGGLSSARNCGLERMSGAFYTFVDSDDEIMPETIERLYCLIQETNVDISMCGRIVRYQRRDVKKFCDEMIICGKYNIYRAFLRYQIPHSAWAKLYRAKDKLLFEEGIIHEETEYLSRFLLNVNKIACCSYAGYVYYMRSDSILHTALSKKNFDYAYIINKTEKLLTNEGMLCVEEFIRFKTEGYLKILKRAIISKKYAEFAKECIPLIVWFKSNIKEILCNKYIRCNQKISVLLFCMKSDFIMRIFAKYLEKRERCIR